MNNMEIYNKVRAVPDTAKKTIGAGRLKGMTDINPQWRIEKLTEVFGMVGIGWRPVITKQWIEVSPETKEAAAFCNIDLYVKVGEDWSEAIPGTGGSKFIAKETSGLYCSDEAFKMAYTDAISVAAKALGMGADVYWSSSNTKYTKANEKEPKPLAPALVEEAKKYGITREKVAAYFKIATEDVGDDEMAKALSAQKAALEKRKNNA